MAYLILNEKGPGTEAMYESWYEFNPGDGVTLGKIEALLSGRNSASREVREQLTKICEQSYKEKSASIPKARFAGGLHFFSKWFTAKKEKAKNTPSRHQYHKKFLHGNPGYKKKLSFV